MFSPNPRTLLPRLNSWTLSGQAVTGETKRDGSGGSVAELHGAALANPPSSAGGRCDRMAGLQHSAGAKTPAHYLPTSVPSRTTRCRTRTPHTVRRAPPTPLPHYATTPTGARGGV